MSAAVQRGVLIWLALAVLATSGCGSGGTLTKKSFQIQAGSIQSFAAEGSMVAQGVAQSRSTHLFVRVHTEYLQKGTKKVEKELRSAHASGDLEQKRMSALKLVAKVSDDLARLHRAPSDRELARQLQSDFTKVADEAEKLAK